MIGKMFLPKSLFGRALLILLLPTVLIQLVVMYVFFDRHWDTVTRHMAKALAGEATFLVGQIEHLPAGQMSQAATDFDKATDLHIYFDPSVSFDAKNTSDIFPEFREQLRSQIKYPFTLRKIENGGMLEVRILLPHEVLRLHVPVKRLESPTTVILVLWMLGTTVVVLLIAVVFLRNQIRPIRRLALAADNFGRGVDTPDFRPSGAAEVRTAARAFITMRERLKRQLRTRTDMLAGISHDLRTPLTRMKLQLAMLGDNKAVHELSDDVQQMEHMIGEYLDFARGAGGEESKLLNLKNLLQSIVEDYRRLQKDITLHAGENVMADVRSVSVRRMLHNLIDNAIRHGKHCEITLTRLPGSCQILVDDDGPGIPPEKYEEVFQPFKRLDPSRNVKTGGVGLGLTIARDIALAHGGGISLEASPKGGLRVAVRLPLTREKK